MGSYYIVVLYEANRAQKVVRFLERHGSVKAVAILALVEDPRILGGLKKMVSRSAVVRGFLPLPSA
jgi:hypothetical protein